ncbi:MAG TPA: hypothetical protein ENK18_03720 [Deltaproteobacteria bacterium]|nr:hypothetical protein [Deltaproteobacteria bacterium]
MMPYAAADPELTAYERSHLDLVRYARILLWVLASLNGAFAVLAPTLYTAAAYTDPQTDPQSTPALIIGGLCVALSVVTVGVLPLMIAAVGLGRGARWGWLLTILAGILYTPSLCLPVGVFLLYAMLNERVRAAFLRD